jgi:lysozyme family protein
MIDNWPASFAKVIASEGGYVNDPADKGGETNLGVTKAAWAEYIGRPVADGEMRALTVDAVKPFYKSRYWDRCKCDDLPAGVDYMVFDFAVNAGVGQSAKFLQRAVGATADGAIGPNTIAKVRESTAPEILESIKQQKKSFYNKIVERNPTQSRFLRGWMNRIAHVQSCAEQMCSGS